MSIKRLVLTISDFLVNLIKINLNHALRLMREYWSEGLLHHELRTRRHGGIRYILNLTDMGRAKLAYFRK